MDAPDSTAEVAPIASMSNGMDTDIDVNLWSDDWHMGQYPDFGGSPGYLHQVDAHFDSDFLYMDQKAPIDEQRFSEQQEEPLANFVSSEITPDTDGRAWYDELFIDPGAVQLSPHSDIPSSACHEDHADIRKRIIGNDVSTRRKPRQQFTPLQISLLESWFNSHIDDPYPDPNDKLFFTVSTGLSLKQVEAWFSRARQKKSREVVDSPRPNQCSDSLYSNTSLDVLHSSIPDEERLQLLTNSHWSDSHLPLGTTGGNHPSMLLGKWNGSHLSWWFQQIPDSAETSGSTNGVTFFSVSNEATRNVAESAKSLSSADVENVASTTSSRAASYGLREQSVSEDGAWSIGSSTSGFSKFSAASHSARLCDVKRRPSRTLHRPCSRMSSVSVASHSKKSSCPPASFGQQPAFKRRKLTGSNTSLVSIDSRRSGYSSTSQQRRQGKRLTSVPFASASSASGRPEDDFWCTYCEKTFKDAYRWQRHEESVHHPARLWICRPIFSRVSEGSDWSDLCSPAAVACWAKAAEDRTFYRKDGMIQHLSLVHKSEYSGALHNNIADKLGVDAHRGIAQYACPFCEEKRSTWEDRVKHLRNHYTNGTAIWPFQRETAPRSWPGTSGIRPTTLADVENFVHRGVTQITSDRNVWVCPICGYRAHTDFGMPYIHSCEQHWSKLSSLNSQPELELVKAPYSGNTGTAQVEPYSSGLAYMTRFMPSGPVKGSQPYQADTIKSASNAATTRTDESNKEKSGRSRARKFRSIVTTLKTRSLLPSAVTQLWNLGREDSPPEKPDH